MELDNVKLVKWNDKDISSMKRADKEKKALEDQGYTLIDTRMSYYGNCLTYRL